MSETPKTPVLPALIELSKVDIKIAILTAEQRRIEGDLAKRQQALGALATKRDGKGRALADKRALVVREEKAIKGERDKLNERRRALSTLGNYKLQQAAEREILFVGKEIGKREDMLLGIMREVELLEKDVVEIESSMGGLQDELQAAQAEAEVALASIAGQLQEAQAVRNEKAGVIGQGAVLTAYNRVRERFPSDPVVPLVNHDSCGGCYMKVGPQVVVQLSRGDVVKCQGCGRFFRLPE
jgi:predicted  nucleic acid-binding Zn-ribbon protein